VLAGAVSLDGDGSTTFIITVSALLPIYLRLGLSPVVLTVVACLANGVLNIVPWGGPTIRAATVLKVSPNELFIPMVPGMIAGLLTVLILAYLLGRSEQKRLQAAGVTMASVSESVSVDQRVKVGGGDLGVVPPHPGGSADAELDYEEDNPDMISGLDPNRSTLRPKLIWFNLILTLALLVMLGLDLFPLPLLFMIASAIALVVNFRNHHDQSERIKAHASSIVAVVAMVFAAAVLVGVLEGTGMVTAMAEAIVSIVPPALGPWFAVITGILSMPFTFFMSNDAFYFGVLPILSEAASQYGITPVQMARASIIGQPVHLTSPLVPAMLLLISLARVDLADFHKKAIWRAAVCSLVMFGVAIIMGVIPVG
jgi:CitMHS family citrate-Mg2+:H+ or citrate-Ca2+:H+ symporter